MGSINKAISVISALAVGICGFAGGGWSINTIDQNDITCVYGAETALPNETIPTLSENSSQSLIADSESGVLNRESIPLAEKEAQELYDKGYFKGTDKGYELSRDVKRSEAITMIVRLMGKETEAQKAGIDPEFDDVISGRHWASLYIGYAKEKGLVIGTGNNHFEPDRDVTGREFMKMVLSAAGYNDITIDNAYDLGLNNKLITSDYSKYVVQNNLNLTRSDVVRIVNEALASLPNNGTGLTEPENESLTFTDKLDKFMPEDENYMFSPLSLKIALGMLANGASGNTESQILSVIDVDDINAFNSSVKNLIEEYYKTDIVKLNIADSMWINRSNTDQNFNKAYQKQMTDYYHAESETVTNDTALDKINGWVSEKTNDKIKSIINSPDFNMMLVNAVYFKGEWENEFDKDLTEKRDFTDKNGEISATDFMNDTNYIGYAEVGNTRIVELPYGKKQRLDSSTASENNDLKVSMYILLDDKEIVAPEYILNNAKFDIKHVHVSIPKFKNEITIRMNETLYSLGIKDAFSSEADYSKMIPEPGLFNTRIIHKTYIDVNEEGTEAAAVTGIGGGGSAVQPEPIDFIADKPFTYIIKDNTNGEILFVGQYAFVRE